MTAMFRAFPPRCASVIAVAGNRTSEIVGTVRDADYAAALGIGVRRAYARGTHAKAQREQIFRQPLPAVAGPDPAPKWLTCTANASQRCSQGASRRLGRDGVETTT